MQINFELKIFCDEKDVDIIKEKIKAISEIVALYERLEELK